MTYQNKEYLANYQHVYLQDNFSYRFAEVVLLECPESRTKGLERVADLSGFAKLQLFQVRTLHTA